jgi:predicted hotdog family 3-hydroxylacyl-ACP dehydratase
MTLKWAVANLLPHSGSMILIGEPAKSGDQWAEAAVRIGEDSLYYKSGLGVPSWVGAEYMAQTIALFAGVEARQAGDDIQIGLLIGCRRYEVETDYFRLGSQLRVHVSEIWTDNQMAVFDCSIEDRKILAKAHLNVFRPGDSAAFLEGGRS